MSDTIDIKGIDKAELLAALHNGTRALGMGALSDLGRDMTVEEAQKYVNPIFRDALSEFDPFHRPRHDGALYFDYVRGRPLKVDITGESMRVDGYDRDAGTGAAARVVSVLRAKAAA